MTKDNTQQTLAFCTQKTTHSQKKEGGGGEDQAREKRIQIREPLKIKWSSLSIAGWRCYIPCRSNYKT